MQKNKDVLINLCRRTFGFVGQDPYNRKKYGNIIAGTTVFFSAMIIVLAILEPVINYVDIETIAHAFEPVSPFIQVVWKSFIFMHNIDRIRYLLNIIDTSFWSDDKFGSERARDYKIFKNRTAMILKIQGSSTALAVIFIIVYSLISKERRFLFDQYQFVDINNNFYFITMYMMNLYTIIPASFMVIGFDMLFISFITHITIQLKMLNYGFTILGEEQTATEKQEEEYLDKLKKYINHHIMLLKFLKEIKGLLSIYLLSHFVSTTVVLCMTTYIINSYGLSEPRMLVYISNIIGYLMQLFVLCLYAEITSSALSDLSDAAYFSGWPNHNLKHFTISSQMVVMRSQRPFKLTAGGIFDVDMISYSRIIKTSFTFLTFLRSVSEENT